MQSFTEAAEWFPLQHHHNNNHSLALFMQPAPIPAVYHNKSIKIWCIMLPVSYWSSIKWKGNKCKWQSNNIRSIWMLYLHWVHSNSRHFLSDYYEVLPGWLQTLVQRAISECHLLLRQGSHSNRGGEHGEAMEPDLQLIEAMIEQTQNNDSSNENTNRAHKNHCQVEWTLIGQQPPLGLRSNATLHMQVSSNSGAPNEIHNNPFAPPAGNEQDGLQPALAAQEQARAQQQQPSHGQHPVAPVCQWLHDVHTSWQNSATSGNPSVSTFCPWPIGANALLDQQSFLVQVMHPLGMLSEALSSQHLHSLGDIDNDISHVFATLEWSDLDRCNSVQEIWSRVCHFPGRMSYYNGVTTMPRIQ